MRLFSAGLHREVTEWDVATLQPLNSMPSGGGPVWSLAAGTQNRLMAACEDGSVRIFSVGDEPGFMALEAKFVVGKMRLLSVCAFGTNELFAGGSDSHIAKWSIKTRSCEAMMAVERSGNAQTLVWTLAALGDHGIASGDSLGLVHVWDPIACVIRYRFLQHQADVLTLTASSEGDTLYTGGVDTKISFFGKQDGQDDRWVYRHAGFVHTHDIRALAFDSGEGSKFPSVLISGGVDGGLRITQVNVGSVALDSSNRPARFRKPFGCSSLSPLLQTACVVQGSRLLLCQRDAHLEFWYLQQPKVGEKGEEEAPKNSMPEGQHVLRVALEGASKGRHLGASAIAPDGRHLAASDEAGTRLFKTNLEDLEVRKVNSLPSEVAKKAARTLLFCTPALLAVAPRASSELLVVDVKQLSVAERFTVHRAPVALLATSGGGEWLASADLAGAVHVFSLDALAHHAQVPAGRRDDGGFPTALGFDSGRHRLIIVTSMHHILLFDVEAQALAAGVTSPIKIPWHIMSSQERVCGVACPPGTKDKLLLWGHSFMVKLDLEAAAEERPQKKQKGQAGTNGHATGGGNQWQKYDGMEHIVALSALEEPVWGAPVLANTSNAGTKVSAKRRRSRDACASQPMVLTLEVTPDSLKKSLPEAFERKKFAS